MKSLHLNWRHVLASGLILSVLNGCGGGGGVEVGGTGNDTPTYATGPITGFGSIIVGGIHYDDSAASLTDEDGQSLAAGSLRLGMVVNIDGKNLDRTNAVATANVVATGSELLGPVAANSPSTGQLTVLGQTVLVNASTVFDDSLAGGQAALTVGRLIEVYGLYDSTTGQYTATRIEPKSAASSYKLRGVVSNLNTTNRTFNIGSASLTYSTAPTGLANGALLRLKLNTSTDGSGRWVVQSASNPVRVPSSGTDVEAEGVISSFASASNFVVNGLTVNAGSATVSGGTLAAGARVEVEGKMSGTVLVATKAEVKPREDSGGGSGGGTSGKEYEITSVVTSLDTVNKLLVLRAGAQKVDYTNATFENGSVANLALGSKLEVKGRLSTDGTVVNASRIKFDN